jgi:hypothetical protein
LCLKHGVVFGPDSTHIFKMISWRWERKYEGKRLGEHLRHAMETTRFQQ